MATARAAFVDSPDLQTRVNHALGRYRVRLSLTQQDAPQCSYCAGQVFEITAQRYHMNILTTGSSRDLDRPSLSYPPQ